VASLLHARLLRRSPTGSGTDTPGKEDALHALQLVGRDRRRLIEEQPAEEGAIRILELVAAGDAQELREERRVLVPSQRADEAHVYLLPEANAGGVAPGLDAEHQVEAVLRLDEPVGLQRERLQHLEQVPLLAAVDLRGGHEVPLRRGDQIDIDAE